MKRESVQSKLDRRIPPRVHITYDVEVGGAIEMRELPFVLGVLASLSGDPDEPLPHLRQRKFVEINWDNFNAVLAETKPRLAFAVDDVITDGDSKLMVELNFRHIEDFEPARVVGQVKPLADLLEKRHKLQAEAERLDSDPDADSDYRAVRNAVDNIDKLLSQQLNLIMHEPKFQRLEASWRGLHYLVSETETGTMLKIRVLNVSKKELLRDFERAAEYDQTEIFKKVYEEEYGTFGASPYGALIGDFEFENLPQDFALLEYLSQVAAIAQAPFIAAAGPKMFGVDSFTEFKDFRDISKVFDHSCYVKWGSFRDSEDSRYVGLTLPRILMRLPYGPLGTEVEEFRFIENVQEDASSFVWGNAAYAFGVCLTTAFAKYYWCATIRGVEGGGLIQGLRGWTFKDDEGQLASKCPTEIAITDRREKELSDLGFIPLVHCKGTDYAAFFSASSCNKPRKYDLEAPNANARLASQLQYVMTVSRFAHYLKAMTRDQIGSFKSRGKYERWLNEWISNYVGSEDNASSTVRAKFPLRDARIDVFEVPGRPGTYRAVMFLWPYFQLDELSVSLRCVVDLPFQTH